jgi:hypothetical protein
MSRARRTLLGLALAAGATACAFWDLEDYSSIVDAGTDAGVDASPLDAAKDAAGDAAVCVPSFSLPFPGLSIRQVLDPSKEVAYVAGGRDVPDGGVGGTGPGYLAVVDACVGKITKAFDPPVANGKATWSLASPSLSGTSVYLAAGSFPPFAGYVRFDPQTETFTQATLPKPSPYSDEIWALAATASGSVWTSGTRATDQVSGIWTVKGDATGQPCSYPTTQGPENHGRAIIAAGNDVYQATADQSMRILHFDDGACAAKAPCGACLPTWVSPSFVVPTSTGSQSVFALRATTTKLYVGGLAVVSAADYLGFVVELDLATRAWGPVFTFNPSVAIDAVVSLAVSSDGTQLYAGAVKGWDGSSKFVSATGMLFTLPIPFTATPQGTSINLPIVAPWSLDADARGIYVGGSSDSTDSLFIKCQSSTQCPTK